MGPEIAIPLIASAVGTGASMYASEKANREQRRLIDKAAANRAEATHRVVSDIEAEAPRYTQENVQRETGDVQAATQDRLLKDLETALSPNTREAPVGKVSADYLERKAARDTEEVARNQNLAKLFAAIDAPNQTRIKQSMDAADARARRNAIMSGSNAYGNNLAAQANRIAPDSVLTSAGGLISAGGQAYSGAKTAEQLKKVMGPVIFSAE